MVTTFDAPTHTYHIDGRKAPSVTQIMADVFGVPFKAGQWYLDRGQAVHACAAMVGRGEDFDNDPRIDGQVEAARRFYREIQPEIIEIEQVHASEQYRYAGTPDLVGIIGKPGKMIVDFKASFNKLVPIQLAGYGLLTNVNKGAGVQLKEDGTYKMTEVYDLRRWKARFLAALTVFNTRRELGIKEDTA